MKVYTERPDTELVLLLKNVNKEAFTAMTEAYQEALSLKHCWK